MKIKIKGLRDLNEEPVFIKCDSDINYKSAYDENGKSFPVQRFNDGFIVLANLKKRKEIELTLSEAICNNPIKFIHDNKVNVYIADKFFTSYVTDGIFAKPFLGPVIASCGESYTRLDLDTKEHPHHRSIFFGIGEVNGVDFWNEPADMGIQKHIKFTALETGQAFARISSENLWCGTDGTPLLKDERTFLIYNQKGKSKYIDIELKLIAEYGDVEFGATKEAGPLGIRMNEQMRADKGNGKMINSYGAEGESECWGRCAHWCDYTGELQNEKYGIAVFDSEQNERYPTAWHIRDYGLFAPNNFYFKGGFTLSRNDSVTYKYRVCFHEADFNITDRFIQYVNNK